MLELLSGIMKLNTAFLNPYFIFSLLLVLSALLIYVKRGSSGRVLLGRRIIFPFYLDLKEAKHIVIFGITGSGKTNTAKLIVKSFKGSKLIIDWNGEYLIGKVAKPSDITINNLSVLEFCEALASSLQLTAPQYAMLLEVAKDSKNLHEIIEKLRKYPIESDTRREIRNALLRRLEPLSYSKLFSGSLTINDVDTIDLSSLTYDAKRLVANVVLRLIYNNPSKQLLVLEEAQNLLIPRRLDQPPSSCELILDEIRKHGVRVLAIAQIPSLVSTTYRNAEYIIIHRLSLTAEEAKNLGLTDKERERIAKLPNGKCMVMYKGKKALIKVSKVNEPFSSLPSAHKTEYEKRIVTTTYHTDLHAKNDILSCILEDLKDINNWRKEITINMNMLTREIDEIKQLTKSLMEKISSIDLRDKHSSLLAQIKGEIDKVRMELNSKIESLEYSLNYMKERLYDFEELIEKT